MNFKNSLNAVIATTVDDVLKQKQSTAPTKTVISSVDQSVKITLIKPFSE